MAQQEKWQNKIGETYPQGVVETVSAWVIIAWNDKESGDLSMGEGYMNATGYAKWR